MEQIYLDHNATTAVEPEVVEEMLPYLGGTFGNASSVHSFGRDAKVALENSREQIAAFIYAKPSELYFTSGGTESDNIAILGTANHLRNRKSHLIIGATEHHAVFEPAEHLKERENWSLSQLPVNSEGIASIDELSKLILDKTAIVSVMHANNETGTIQDVESLAELTKSKGVLFHTDAVQSVGKIPVDVRKLKIDLLSLTAHKIYGPKGIGALFIREGVKILPLFYGGSHEKKRRPGTENVAGAVGFAKALEIAGKRMNSDHERLSDLSNYFIERILDSIPDVVTNGSQKIRTPQTVNLSFVGIEGESILLSLDLEGIACSSGSACTSGATEPSHVLTAMGKPKIESQGAIRFSLGRSTTREQLDYVLEKLPPIIERLRSMSPVYERS